MKVLVVIPALNEEHALPALVAELRACAATQAHQIEAMVIDDGSTDATSKVARQAGARCVRLPRNLGIGGAVQTGLKVAEREGFDCAVQLDGDGQHPPSELQTLLAALEGADLVVGSRYLTKEGYQSTALRRLGSWWLSSLLSVVAKLRITDPTSGYRVYGRRALTLFSRSYPSDYPEPESLAFARSQGLQVREVAVQMRARQGGASSIFAFAAPYYMIKVSLAVVLAYFRKR